MSPAITLKSAPAMARMVPPFSVYGLNARCWAILVVVGVGVVQGGGTRNGRARSLNVKLPFPVVASDQISSSTGSAASYGWSIESVPRSARATGRLEALGRPRLLLVLFLAGWHASSDPFDVQFSFHVLRT